MKKHMMIIYLTSIVLTAFFIAGIALAKPVSSRITNRHLAAEQNCETTPVCAILYQDSLGTSWVVVVQYIKKDSPSGFGACTPGEYVRLKIQTTKPPGGGGDSASLVYECFDQNTIPTCNNDGRRNPKNYFDEIQTATFSIPTNSANFQ